MRAFFKLATEKIQNPSESSKYFTFFHTSSKLVEYCSIFYKVFLGKQLIRGCLKKVTTEQEVL